jgi:hypothetical protein
VETASCEMVMGAVQTFCVFSLLVSQQNHLDPSLQALGDGLKRFAQVKGIVQKQQKLKSSKAKVNDHLALESHQLHEKRYIRLVTAMETIVYGVEMVSTTKGGQVQVHLNRAQQAATTWSDADHLKAIE